MGAPPRKKFWRTCASTKSPDERGAFYCFLRIASCESVGITLIDTCDWLQRKKIVHPAIKESMDKMIDIFSPLGEAGYLKKFAGPVEDGRQPPHLIVFFFF